MNHLPQFHLPPQLCPNCGEAADATTGLTGGEPHEGGIVVCLYCGAVNRFNHWLRLKLVEDVSSLGLNGDERKALDAALTMAAMYREKAKRPSISARVM